jgi:hypothetical protein
MNRSTPKKAGKPTEKMPRKGKPRDPVENVEVKPINPPGVGGNQRGEGPKKA